MSDKIGKFLKSSIPHPGEQPVPPLSTPAPIPHAPTPEPPPLSHPTPVSFEPAPKLTSPAVIEKQPAPALTSPAPVPFEPAPTLTKPAAVPFEPAPPLITPQPIPFEPAPPPHIPDPIPFEPAPPPHIPEPIPFEPAPPPHIPDPIPFEPAPPPHIPEPIPFEPAPPPHIPDPIPFEPAPPPHIPDPIPFEPAPPPHIPDPIPFEPAPPPHYPEPIPPEPAPPIVYPLPIPLEPAPPPHIPEPIPFEPPPPLTDPVDPPLQPAPPPYPRPRGPQEPVSTPPPMYWSDIIARAEMERNSVGGVIQGIGREALAALMSLNVTAGIGVNIPGMGMLPVGINIGPSGMAVTFPWQKYLHNAADNAISYGRARAQAFLQANVAALSQKVLGELTSGLGIPSGFITNLTPGQAIAGIPNVARNAPGGLLIERSTGLQFGAVPTSHPPPSKTTLPDEQVQVADSEFPYAKDSREVNQALQQAQADISTDQMDMYNSWNDQFTYSKSASEKQSKNLQGSYDASNQDSLSAYMIGKEGGDDAKGYFPYRGSDQKLPSDDQAYIPLVFTDLRPSNQTFRTVYFRPFIKSLSENIAPQWNKTNYFGRVDPVATYKSTDRTLSVTFALHCFQPEDLAINIRKLAWLNSMCYPQYSYGMYFAGPVVRMRVGDIISATGGVTGKGVPGIITSLDLNYGDSIWELNQDQKLPRVIEVNLGFQVLHDRAIGLVNGSNGMTFGGVSGDNADIKKFRAAFGDIDYLNSNSLPGIASAASGQTNLLAMNPTLVPTQATQIADYTGLTPDPSQVLAVQNAQNWPNLGVDSGLGSLFG